MRLSRLSSLGPRHLIRALFFRDGISIFTALSVADFRNLWFGQMISFVGDAIAYNTLTLAIIRMANDAGEKSGGILSLLFVLSALPSLFLGMVAGTLVDRVNRKHVMITADILRGILVLGYLFVQDLDHVWVYIIVSIWLSTVSTFFFPARTAMLPQILKDDKLLAANALAQLTQTLAFVVGAATAGFLVGIADATEPAFLIDSFSFFLSAFFIARISISGKLDQTVDSNAAPAASRPQTRALRSLVRRLRSIFGELLVGLRYVLSDQVMRGVLISFLALFLGLGAANVTFVPLLIDELGMPEEGLGLVRFSQTAGIILGSTIIAAIAARYKARDLIGLSMAAFGITTVIVSIVDNYLLMVGVLFAVGLALSPPQIVAATLMQRHVPSSKLGRASGAQGTIINVANIASMGAAGLLMDEIGARAVFFISGVIIFSAGLVSWWVLRGVEASSTPPHDDSTAHSTIPEQPAPETILVPDPAPEA